MQQIGTIIGDRYQINQILGQGGSGITYQAQDQRTGNNVALKEMSLSRLKEWKDLDLFEREARVLSYLDHPAIPKYLDYLEIDSSDTYYFYLVQELATGNSLFDLVEKGWRVTEAEVISIATQLLHVLIYLHSQSPPILHRDIKPHNVIYRPNGSISLVDFGSVRQAYWSKRNQGITVVGTLGYMAPEQDRGLAYPASDLYGVAATLLFLLTQRSPAELPQKRLKIDFQSRLQISSELGLWLEKMLEPIVEDRFHSARQALLVLEQPQALFHAADLHPHQPLGSKIKLQQQGQHLQITIPPSSLPGFRGIGGNLNIPALIILLLFIIAALITLLQGRELLPIVVVFGFYPLIFGLWGLIFSRNIDPIGLLFRFFGNITLEFNQDQFKLQWSCCGFKRQKTGKVADIEGINIITKDKFKLKFYSVFFKKDRHEGYIVPIKKCAIALKPGFSNKQTLEFGQFLAPREQEWLVEQINTFLQNLSDN